MIENIIHHVAVGVIIFLLAKWFPSKKVADKQNDYNVAKLGKKFQKYDWLALLGLFVIVPCFVYLIHLVLERVIDFLSKSSLNNSFVSFESPSIIFATCLGFIFCVKLTEVFIKSIVGLENYRLYDLYCELQYNIDNTRLARAWMVFFGALSVIIIYLMGDWYMKIENDKIEYNTFSSLESKFYPMIK